MKTENGVIVLEDLKAFSPYDNEVCYTDMSGTRISIPMKVLIHLYEGSKSILERRGINWKKYCDKFFANKFEVKDSTGKVIGEDIGEMLNEMFDNAVSKRKDDYVPHKLLDLKKTPACRAPVREAVLQFIREGGSEGKRFTDIQRYYAEACYGIEKYDSKKNRGCGAIMFYGHGQLFARYCFKKNGKWVLDEFKEGVK